MAGPDTSPLFCPFCGECVEGETLCPEHEIPLVPFDQLDRMRGRSLPAEHEEVATHDLRFGRGWVFGGAALVVLGFFSPFLRSSFGTQETSATGFEVASSVALNLWVLPLLAITWTSILSRRRTPAQMRGARLAIPALCVLAAASLGYTMWRVHQGAARIHQSYGREVEVEPRIGILLVIVGLVLAFGGGIRLGNLPKAAPPRYKIE